METWTARTDPQGPTGTRILAAIEALSTKMQTKIGEVTQEVNLLRAELRKVAERSLTTEQDVTKLKEELAALKTTVTELTCRMHQLEIREEDAEGRS